MPQCDADARGAEQREAGAQRVERCGGSERVRRQAQAPGQFFVDRIGERHGESWTRTARNAATWGAPSTTCARAARTLRERGVDGRCAAGCQQPRGDGAGAPGIAERAAHEHRTARAQPLDGGGGSGQRLRRRRRQVKHGHHGEIVMSPRAAKLGGEIDDAGEAVNRASRATSESARSRRRR